MDLCKTISYKGHSPTIGANLLKSKNKWKDNCKSFCNALVSKLLETMIKI